MPIQVEVVIFDVNAAKLNFSGPELVFAKFWEVLKKSSGLYKVSRLGAGVRWGRVSVPPAGLRQGY